MAKPVSGTLPAVTLGILAAGCAVASAPPSAPPREVPSRPPEVTVEATEPGRFEGVVRAVDPAVGVYLVTGGSTISMRVGDELTITRDGHFVATVVVQYSLIDRASVTIQRSLGVPMKKTEIRVGDRFSWIIPEPTL